MKLYGVYVVMLEKKMEATIQNYWSYVDHRLTYIYIVILQENMKVIARDLGSRFFSRTNICVCTAHALLEVQGNYQPEVAALFSGALPTRL